VILENVGNDRSRLPDAAPINRAVSASGTQHAKGYTDVVFDDSVAFLKRTLDV
jgi:hypothetical protein